MGCILSAPTHLYHAGTEYISVAIYILFLPQASSGLKILSLPVSVWVYLCVCVCASALSLFSCDQAALQMVFSLHLSVCPSVRLSHLFHYVPIILSSWNVLELLPMTKGPCKRSRSKVKVTEVKTQLNHSRTVTPVWIHIWWWNYAHGLTLLRRGAVLFFKVIHQISRSHGSKNCLIWPRLGVSGL